MQVKLGWMNGQHLRNLPEEESSAMAVGHLISCGLLASADSPFAAAAVKLVSKSMVGRCAGSSLGASVALACVRACVRRQKCSAGASRRSDT